MKLKWLRIKLLCNYANWSCLCVCSRFFFLFFFILLSLNLYLPTFNMNHDHFYLYRTDFVFAFFFLCFFVVSMTNHFASMCSCNILTYSFRITHKARERKKSYNYVKRTLYRFLFCFVHVFYFVNGAQVLYALWLHVHELEVNQI